MLRTVAIACIATIILSGCGFFGEPKVSCNEESTKALVKEIFTKQITEQFDELNALNGQSVQLQGLSISIDNVRPDSFDATINKYTCKADLNLSLPINGVSEFTKDRTAIAIFKLEGISIRDTGISAPIQFISQAADGGEHHYVELMQNSPIEHIVSLAANMLVLDQRIRSSPSSQTLQSQNTSEDVLSQYDRPDGSGDEGLTAAVGPSFDCAKARTEVEMLICSNPIVAELDMRMSEAYRQALAISNDRPAFTSNQSEWIKKERNTCKTADCLQAEYQARIAMLEESK